jgi:hypothetical protein
LAAAAHRGWELSHTDKVDRCEHLPDEVFMARSKHPATQRIGGPGASHENRRQPEKSKAHAELASADKKAMRPPQRKVAPEIKDHDAASVRGSSKPSRGSKRPDTSQDGAHKGGGINALRHGGPKRPSKTPPTGVKGSQLQKRTRG